ncbi:MULTISPECIES: SHOCT domain-containing protein [Lysinibacillus]|uniref:SHOCT domain-containing protein n=1 Tax=Lysinibacillus TaxID=400634 RepID=UPI002584CBD1|nr:MULTISPECIES: SHOCT domain-containing protein [Lysinibacillus]
MGVGIGCLGLIIIAIIFFSALSSGDISSGLIWFCIIGGIISAFGGLIIDAKRKGNLSAELVKKMREILEGIENFNATQEFFSTDMETMIAIDEDNKKVLIINNKIENVAQLSQTLNKYDYEYKIYLYKDILQSEIIEDDVTVTRTSRGSQIGGALLGGVLAGGVGAIIGGLSGSTTSTNEVKKVQLQIVVNNTKKSFYRITFMSSDTVVSKNSSIYINSNKQITHWHSLLKIIIDIADKEDKKNTIQSINNNNDNKINPSNVADEIRKLHDLLKEGIINQEEFDLQKKKIIS